MTKSFLKEMESCPTVMNAHDIVNVLRVSIRTAFRVLNELKRCGAAFNVGEGLQVTKQDLIEWLDDQNY